MDLVRAVFVTPSDLNGRRQTSVGPLPLLCRLPPHGPQTLASSPSIISYAGRDEWASDGIFVSSLAFKYHICNSSLCRHLPILPLIPHNDSVSRLEHFSLIAGGEERGIDEISSWTDADNISREGSSKPRSTTYTVRSADLILYCTELTGNQQPTRKVTEESV